MLAPRPPVPDAGEHVVEVVEQESDPLSPRHRFRYYAVGVYRGNGLSRRPRSQAVTASSLEQW